MSKRQAFLLAIIGISSGAFCQKYSYKQQATFGVHFLLNDFKTAANIRLSSLSATLREGKFGRIGDMSPGIALNYIQGLSNKLDFTSTLGGSFLDYPQKDTVYSGEKKLLLEADLSIRAKMFSIGYWLSPYLQLGAGISKYTSNWGAFIPAGTGLQVNISRELYLIVNAQYRFPITENTVSRHFYYSVGVAGIFGKKLNTSPKKVTINPVPVYAPTDRDGDGILDSADACPDRPGMARFRGCPDRDNDSIPDVEDSCPLVFGLKRYNGCPIPDSDNDGINDEEDKCVMVPGVVKYQGCPPPDRDRDGVEDEADNCPDIPGTTSANGCPEKVEKEHEVIVEEAAKQIFFATGSYRLLPSSYKHLDKIAGILSHNPKYRMTIEGHTDDIGSIEANDRLSRDRAKAVKDYLVKKGIDQDRLAFEGYGEKKPVADNGNPTGRAKNRRVEMKLRYN